MADEYDERAEKRLPCLYETSAYDCRKDGHHSIYCPAYHRSAVAAELRELGRDRDTWHSRAQVASERADWAEAELAAAQGERDELKERLGVHQRSYMADTTTLTKELDKARAELEAVTNQYEMEAAANKRHCEMALVMKQELETLREAAREVIAQYQYKATPPEYPLMNRAVLFLERALAGGKGE